MVVTDLKDRILGGRYKLQNPLGHGGMALVFQAYDQLLERPVAIKLLRKDYSKEIGFKDRFLQEARAAANLSHPNIVAIYDFGIDNEEIFIVMELVTGSDLKTLLQSGKNFSIEEGLDLGQQITAALGYAHRAGIVHCDVKPQNIIISTDHVVKITDFGISRALSSTSSTQTSELVWGSPQYMAPEVINGALPTPQSDVYSIGIVLYEMFTNHPPIDGDSVSEILEKQRSVTPESIQLRNNGFPESLDQLILKTLSKEPALRYRNADQMGNVLSLIKSQLNTTQSTHLSENYPAKNSNPGTVLISYEDSPINGNPSGSIDWSLIGAELLALLMVGGLIPFWLFVFYSIRPLLR